MEQKFHFIIQDEIKKDVEVKHPENSEVFSFSGCDRNFNWKDYLQDLEKNLEEDKNNTVISFLTIQCAGYWSRYNPNSLITKGLLFPSMHNMYDYRNPLFWNVWNSIIPDNMKLNNTFQYTTIRDIIQCDAQNIPKNWNHVFVKPVSPWKPFTGFDCDIKNLKFELEARMSLEHVDDSELIIVDEFKNIDSTEWRMYFIENELVTFAPYSWEELDLKSKKDLPNDIKNAGEKAAILLSKYGDNYVIDAVQHNNKAKIIEVNAISTSGWYQNIDSLKLLKKCSSLFDLSLHP
jgi:hypothetical protein